MALWAESTPDTDFYLWSGFAPDLAGAFYWTSLAPDSDFYLWTGFAPDLAGAFYWTGLAQDTDFYMWAGFSPDKDFYLWSLIAPDSDFYFWTLSSPDSDFYLWTGLSPDFYLKAWVKDSEPGFSDQDKWSSWINPTAGKKQTFLGVGEAIEDLHLNPEDMDLEVEDIQEDQPEWDIKPAGD